MQATAGPFPWADAAPTQPQGRSGKHYVASTCERSMLYVEMGSVGAERPFWRQLGTVPYSVKHIAINYGKLRSSKLQICRNIQDNGLHNK
jgi:hypothetical protein